MKFALALVAALLLAGCNEEADAQRARNKGLMPAWNSHGAGSAAEMRTWEDRDGGLWCVVGRPEHFVVWFKPKAAEPWSLAYAPGTGKPVPAAVKMLVEPSP